MTTKTPIPKKIDRNKLYNFKVYYSIHDISFMDRDVEYKGIHLVKSKDEFEAKRMTEQHLVKSIENKWRDDASVDIILMTTEIIKL